MIVSQCSDPNATIDAVQGCHNVNEGLLPTTDMHTNITYANTLCAECNGVDKHVLAPWQLQVVCEKHDEIPYINISGGSYNVIYAFRDKATCRLQWLTPKDLSAFQCYRNQMIVSTCTGGKAFSFRLDYLCKTQPRYLYKAKFKVYRNVYCFLCHEKDAIDGVHNCHVKTELNQGSLDVLVDVSQLSTEKEDKTDDTNVTCETANGFVEVAVGILYNKIKQFIACIDLTFITIVLLI